MSTISKFFVRRFIKETFLRFFRNFRTFLNLSIFFEILQRNVENRPESTSLHDYLKFYQFFFTENLLKTWSNKKFNFDMLEILVHFFLKDLQIVLLFSSSFTLKFTMFLYVLTPGEPLELKILFRNFGQKLKFWSKIKIWVKN